MKLKITILIALLFLGAERVSAQSAVVTGRVTETVDGQAVAVPGVSVMVVNTQERTLTGAITGSDGTYRLSVPTNESDLSLVYAFIGMESQTFAYTGQRTLDVTMKPGSEMIEDVVVTGRRTIRNAVGISQKEQVAAVQRLEMDAIMAASPVNSLEEALQGRLGGVDIVTSGGDPGGRSSIRIRGTGTLTANAEPLIVIDGVPYTNDLAEENFDFSNATDENLGALLNISPDDIESIEVLKDAASTAIWGTRGGNGVLIINLKKGGQGRTNFTFSSKLTARFEPETIPMLDGLQYTTLMQEAIWNSANYIGMNTAENNYLELLFNTPAISYDPAFRYFDEYNQDTRWLDEIRRTGLSLDNNFSMNGGGDKASYRFSMGQLSDQGTTIGEQLQRVSSTLDVDYQFSRRLRFGANFAYTQSTKDGNLESTRSEAFRKMPNKSPYWIDPLTGERTGLYFSEQTREFEGLFERGSSWDKASNYNPIAMIHEGINNSLSREGRITFRLESNNILPGLQYSGFASLNMNTSKRRRFIPQVATGVVWTDINANLSTDELSDRMSLQTENKLIYIKNWNDIHNLVATGVFRTSQNQSTSYSSQTSGNGSAELSDPIIGAVVTGMGSAESESRSASATFLFNYTLLDRYVVQGSMTMEGNSAMGNAYRTGYFPMAGLSWNVQEENFLQGARNWIDEIKLRAALGQTGRAPGGTALYLGAFGTLGEYMDMNAIYPTRMQLDRLKWETSTEFNLGMDVVLFRGKVTASFDHYTKTTRDLLLRDYKIPSTTGYNQVGYFNSGELLNRGWEFRAGVTLFENDDWRIASHVNFSRNVNEIVELSDNMVQENYSFGNGKYAVIAEEGRPAGSFYGYRYQGVFQNKEQTYARDSEGNIMNNAAGNPIVMRNGTVMVSPGDASYEDINHDGVINEYDIVYLGNYMPTLIAGGGLNVRWKQLTLNLLFIGRFGQKVINQVRMNNESMYGPNNQSVATLRRWRNEGDETDIPRALYNEGYNYLGSDRFVEDASFLRLQEVSLSYRLPKPLLDRWGFSNLNVFVTGYNLLTWSGYTGQDPEVRIPGKATDLAMDNALTPVAKRLTCGIRMNF